MKFRELSEYLQKLEKTPSRNKMTEILAALFKKARAAEIDKICYLLLGSIAPSYTGLEFNLAEKMVMRAIALAYRVGLTDVTRRYKQMGDLGDVGEAIAKTRPKEDRPLAEKLTVGEVYKRLYKIATEGGAGSQERKLSGMAEFFKSLDPLSVRYVARIPVGKLRLGFSDVTILDSLSMMEVGNKSARKRIEAVYNVTADIGKIAQRIKEHGLRNIENVKPEPGVPIRPSLADRLPTAEKIIEKVGPKVAVEGKLDGFRMQVHVWTKNGKREVRLFSRNQENTTLMFPEIVQAAKKLNVKNVILDGEAIGYNPKDGQFSPFQETVQRKRKYDIEEMAQKVPLKFFAFDVLLLNGKSLLQEPFSKRREVLEKLLEGKDNGIRLVVQDIVDTPAVLRQKFEFYAKKGLEGLVAKKLDVAYQAGGRGFHWVKYKKYSEGHEGGGGGRLADTIDCVLMGAYRGRGKRAKFGVGGFLLGVRGTDDEYYTISNLGTGLSDEQFREMYKTVQKLKVSAMPKEYVVDKLTVPDIWVRPQLVLEILADEITLSSRHTAGMGKSSTGRAGRTSSRGYSLRFPRLIRVRDDKNPEDATSVKEVERLYRIQSGK